jgi:hypothetical protein
MKRIALAAVLAAVACSVPFANSGTFSELSASVAAFNQPAPLYTNEQERLVSAIAGSILNIAAFADHFEASDPFQVRNAADTRHGARFTVVRRAEVFTVDVGSHVWAPRAYGRIARNFMADGAGLSISEDLAGDRQAARIGNDTPEQDLARENARLSGLLQAHPRSAVLHEKAALLLAVAAAGRATGDADIRPLLCRMTAHLAIARALHGDVLSGDGQLAERLLGQLADRERTRDRVVMGSAQTDGPVVFGDNPSLSILPLQ